MDEQRELDSIREKTFQLCKKLAHLRKIPMPERAEETGREGLRRLHTFLEEYAGLLSQEYGWCE